MRKKVRKATEKEFLKQVQEALPEFSPCGAMGMWSPALRFSTRDTIHFFLALMPFEDRDCFSVMCGFSNSPDFPDYVETSAPTDPLYDGALSFSVGRLWQRGGMAPYWCLVRELDLDDPIESWGKPAPSQEEILPKIPEIVRQCIADFKQPVLDFIKKHTEQEP